MSIHTLAGWSTTTSLRLIRYARGRVPRLGHCSSNGLTRRNKQECQEIEATNRALLDELDAVYHDLPLNKDVAAGALLEARLELQRLEDQFNSRIQQMI